MSQTHGGELSGVQPCQDYSACGGQSLSHITGAQPWGAGPSVQTCPPPQGPSLQHNSGPQSNSSYHTQAQRSAHHAQEHHHHQQRHQGGGGGSSYLEPPLGGPPATTTDSHAPPQDFVYPPNVYDNSMMLREQGDGMDDQGDEHQDHDGGMGGGGQDFDDNDGNSQGSGKRSRTRRPHLQGRFSGRLTTKEDERRLAEECKLLGPLLGGVGKRGDKSRLTLAKIVRGIATGEVRRFCEDRERGIALLKSKLAAIDPEAAASVPVNAIPLPSAGLGGITLGPMGIGMASGSMGGPSMSLSAGGSMGVSLGHHSIAQMEALQRENSELNAEVYSLRSELQARERLLLELQETGIISGFVPTSISLDDRHRLLHHDHHGMGGPMGRNHSADVGPPGGYGMGSRGYSAAPYGSGGSLGLAPVRQANSGLDGGGMGSGMAPGPAALSGQGGGGTALGAGGAGGLESSLGAMPAVSEASRASRPLKRPANVPDMGAGGAGAGGYGDVPRSLSHPALGRGAGGALPTELHQQLNNLQAQVEQLQSMQGGRGGNFVMPNRERSAGAPMRMGGGGGGGGGLNFGGGNTGGGAMGNSTFTSGGQGGGGGGMMGLAGGMGSDASNPYGGHGSMSAPLQLQQALKAQLFDDNGGPGPRGGQGSRPGGGGNGGGGNVGDNDGPYGSGGAVGEAGPPAVQEWNGGAW
ncbi:hypothetical protein HYH03_001648 [Edaphochlamys debaryana]|uniref:Uncharacterized protein n=1 Tax=Edaphochlamys debaryana TaxID=47281 RepID=A0A836C6G1_9CHLO|nr:hypothetical protein HYH03_001648 [Edaphochlamys debaryana]|eukprot:KAG2500889.1 hypothetical protein HYH03_001648 [Edaphochlamys debaryana]